MRGGVIVASAYVAGVWGQDMRPFLSPRGLVACVSAGGAATAGHVRSVKVRTSRMRSSRGASARTVGWELGPSWST